MTGSLNSIGAQHWQDQPKYRKAKDMQNDHYDSGNLFVGFNSGSTYTTGTATNYTLTSATNALN